MALHIAAHSIKTWSNFVAGLAVTAVLVFNSIGWTDEQESETPLFPLAVPSLEIEDSVPSHAGKQANRANSDQRPIYEATA